MSSGSQLWEVPTIAPAIATASTSWYAVQTRARHEKIVAHKLRQQGLDIFLPLMTETHRWSDRRKIVEVPLFSCYLFANLALSNEQRSHVCRVDGVLNFVGVRGEGTSIPDEQIESIRTLTAQQLACSAHPFLKVGQRVRIRGGALDGVEGILQSQNGDRTLVVSIDAIQRSLAVRIEGYDVEPA
jgi:transcription elongation factor/antiterminator RfaH